MDEVATALATRFFTVLARLSHYSPRGKARLAMFFLRFASNEHSTPSIYGPALRTRWHDTTFRFCVSGMYGKYLSDFLCKFPYPYSFIDIGANIGLYSLLAFKSLNCKNCYAFEPNPIVFKSLQQNIELNYCQGIQVYNYAVSETAGTLYFATTEAHSGTGKLVDANIEGSIKVKSVDKKIFDDIAAADKLPKVVKIDVEGHEPIVINELMKSSIWSDIRYLYFEANESRYDLRRLVAQLEDRGLRKIYHNGKGDDFDLMFERPPPA
jgi:FkbM family methyltransferase